MVAFDPGTVYLVVAGIIVGILVIISLFCNDGSKKKAGRGRVGAQAAAPVARPRAENAPPGARRRAGGPRRRMRVEEDSDEDPPLIGDEEEAGMFDDFEQHEGKIGAKKLRKLQEKEEKRRMREMELQEREEKKERERKMEEQRKKDEAKLKAEEEIRAEEERLRKEEQEKREHEEYLKLKAEFTVDESGEMEQDGGLDSQSLLEEFISYIQERKVVMLEDLAAQFKLKTQDCIQRVNDLQAEGKLTGVVDDRGKFIYITMEELESVAKYIRQHGRVSIQDLAESSNRLINLNPDNSDTQKKVMAVG